MMRFVFCFQDGLIKSVEFGVCLQCSGESVKVAPCNKTEPQQKWSFEEYRQLYWDIKERRLQNTDYTKKLADFIKED